MTVCLAALQAIPTELYEVADLDGANSWQRFRAITWPFMLAAITPLIIISAPAGVAAGTGSAWSATVPGRVTAGSMRPASRTGPVMRAATRQLATMRKG